ncbi:hypothetical protein ONR57_18475 [Hoyosella sp. YIM 151337]|uniref:hypothetical protein n=1 Tax=Hoyosella sp. YIM 151337 TaxID=2992742 RepID=UPI00223669EA|nr:hypothetical protein [Hoyosella sp. YIM 151337]MCW4355294.1 hypothetical protein [Hoyosella sp. YIM 151337]
MVTRTRPAGVAAIVAALVLAGCSPGIDEREEQPADDAPPAAEPALRALPAESIEVPGEWYREDDYAGLGMDFLAPAEGVPFAFALNVAAPREPAHPQVWLSDDGFGWFRADVAADYQGAFTGGLIGNPEVSGLAGVSYEEGTLRSRLWRSADRREWHEVELPPEFAQTFRVSAGAAAGQRIYLAGVSVGKELAVAIVDGADVEYVTLPPIADRDQRLVVDAAAFDDSVVVLVQHGEEGAAGRFETYTSDDGGATWSSPTRITDDPDIFLSGMAWTGDRFLVTGGARDPDTGGLLPAAWTSEDGQRWDGELVPPPPDDSVFYVAEGVDTVLGRPAVRDGIAFMVGSNDDSLRAGFYNRNAAGEWAFTGTSDLLGFPGVGGLTLSVNPDEQVAILSPFGAGLAVVGVHGREDAWRELERSGALEQVAQVDSATPAPRHMYLETLRVRYEADGPEFRSTPERALWQLTEDRSLHPIPYEPPEVAEMTDTVTGAFGQDDIVLAGSRFSPTRQRVEPRAWFRSVLGEPWEPAGGFGDVIDVRFTAVHRIGEEWVASGTSADAAAEEPVGRPSVWTSGDGRGWSDAIILDDDAGVVSDVCALPGGGLLAVGSLDNGDVRVPAAWRNTGEEWDRATAEILTTGVGVLTGCAGSGSGVVIGASTGGRNIVLRTEDGIEFAGVFRTGYGSSMGRPVPVNAGYAAPGRFTSDDASGPVVWLSADGIRWTPWRIPSHTDGITRGVQPFGDGVVVTMDSEVGPPVQIVQHVDPAAE